MKSNFRKLTELGQSIWCDNIRRGMIASGELQALIDEGVLGVTSNPTILQKAIGQSSDYDAVIRDLVAAGTRAPSDIYESLAFDDIGRAADVFRPVYEGTERRDGFVSIEVEPALADDTESTVARAKQIFSTLGRPNVMIKVPATDAGLPAVARLIGEGINVNVTLIFSVDIYQRVIDAYITGLAAYLDGGGDPGGVASVASFFVSRVDTVVDQRLQERIAAGQTHLAALLGRAAVANAKVAYDKYMDQFCGPAFADLATRGARVQRPLWASTSTKNPAYRDTIYVDTLIGPNTVNTAPPVTLDAIRRFDGFRATLQDDVELARATLVEIEQVGVSMAEVTEELRQAGVQAFADSFDRLLADIQAKVADLAGR